MQIPNRWRTIASEAAYLKRKMTGRFARGRLTAANPIGDFEWNELPSGQGDELNSALVSLVAFDAGGTARALGTGFILRYDGPRAYGATAAHVLWDAAHKAQSPNSRAHPSTPSFFQSDFESVHVGPRRLRAAFANIPAAAFPSVTFVIWDKRADVAFFEIENDGDEAAEAKFDMHFPVTNRVPNVGERVGVLAYADMAAEPEGEGTGFRSFSLKRRMCLRVGRVRALHPNGHLLCRGPCIETSIPVFAGMSGGPAFFIPKPNGELEAFGLISGDPEETAELKQHRWHRGSSIMAVLPITKFEKVGAVRNVEFRVEDVGLGKPIGEAPEPMSIKRSPDEGAAET